jgi:hypothetical protein
MGKTRPGTPLSEADNGRDNKKPARRPAFLISNTGITWMRMRQQRPERKRPEQQHRQPERKRPEQQRQRPEQPEQQRQQPERKRPEQQHQQPERPEQRFQQPERERLLLFGRKRSKQQPTGKRSTEFFS